MSELQEPLADLNDGGRACPSDAVPSRKHLVFALVAGFALIALPLAMWVRPAPGQRDVDADSDEQSGSLEAQAVSTGAAPPPKNASAKNASATAKDDALGKSEPLSLGDVWIDKCEKPGAGKTPPDRCDRQPWFEEALQRAVRENSACAPDKNGTLSVVMRVDYPRRKLEVFAGKRGTIQGRAAEGVLACIRRSVPDPPWNTLEHEHTKYIIALVATYSGKD